MTHTRRGRARRTAFTLIEMLVVILIIALLVSLTAAAVLRALVKGPEITDRSEMGEMETKITSLQRDFNLAVVPPSHLRLREDGVYTSANPAIQQDYDKTKIFLQAMFGRHITDQGVPWSDGQNIHPNVDLVLEGEQCLVFYLGGHYQQDPTTGLLGMVGFPTQVSGGSNAGKRGPFFEFQPARLKMFTAPGSGLPFPVYLDPWKAGKGPWGPGTPYAYFSSYNTEGLGDYHDDCPSLLCSPPTNLALSPHLTAYMDPSGKWVNAGSFQIISAGKDGKFGPGATLVGGKWTPTYWNPTKGTTDPNGQDDQANFSPRVLGAAAQ